MQLDIEQFKTFFNVSLGLGSDVFNLWEFKFKFMKYYRKGMYLPYVVTLLSTK